MRVPVPGRNYFYAEKAYDEFIENVVKEIHKKRPDLTLNFFAYVNYCSPYKDFKLTPGISVQLANYWRCVNHDLFSANCPSNKGFLNDLLAWEKAKAGGELMIYEYYMGINFYMSLPLIFEKRIFDEFEYYKSHKVDGVLTQFQMGHWSIYGSNYKAMSMAARGEDYTCTIKTILQNRFGKYAAIAEKFFQDIKNITDLNDNCHIPTPASLFSRISVKQLEQLQPVARKLARNLPYARPAADLEIWIKYLITFKKLYDMDVNRTIKVQDMTKFITWIKRQKKRKIFAITQVIHYLSLWLEDVKNNVPCRFFDVDWPKEFERRKNIDKKQ